MVESRGALAQDGRRAERLELRVPTTPTQLPAVRAMAGDLAIRMDYDLDAVEDLRLAVDEACATLAQIAAGDAPLTVIFETTRAGLHIEAWVPTPEGTDVPRDGFGWAILATLVDAVDARRATQADVPAGDGSTTPVGLIAMDKYLPGQRPQEPGTAPGNEAGQNLSVAR
jgi:serine/threonine-protein kinase RsbW